MYMCLCRSTIRLMAAPNLALVSSVAASGIPISAKTLPLLRMIFPGTAAPVVVMMKVSQKLELSDYFSDAMAKSFHLHQAGSADVAHIVRAIYLHQESIWVVEFE